MTYMHIPQVNWGMRTLTQVLYAQLAWDVHTDVASLLQEYFIHWYGPYATPMRTVYTLIEEAWQLSATWRAWGPQSVLTQLQAWDGTMPQSPLKVQGHFATPQEAIESGRHSIEYMRKAMHILNETRITEQRASAQRASLNTAIAVNPLEARRLEPLSPYEMRLGEDRRLLRYGIDMMTLMTELVAYHDALYRREAVEAETVWQRVEHTAEALDSYYVPIDFAWPGPGLVSKDGLTRSQLRALLHRCRKQRMRIDQR
jgi:hypothetical protein